MRKLRRIALDLDRSDWPNSYGYGFCLRSRSLCNFLERTLRKTPVEIVDSTKLVITGHASDDVRFNINSSNIACLRVPFGAQAYDDCSSDQDINSFMVSFLTENLQHLPGWPCGPSVRIVELADSFVELEYVNCWTHKRKRLRDLGVTAALNCALTPSKFTLTLQVEKQGVLILDDTIFESEPDEIAFHSKFKDIVAEGDHLVVTSRFDRPLMRIKV